MEAAIREEKMKAEVIDVTLPSKKSTVGHRHPNTIALEEVERNFRGNGIRSSRRTGSRIRPVQLRETQHSGWASCKDEQDTFYVNKDIVLRTQTSSGFRRE